MPTKTHIAEKCTLGAAAAIHLVHSRLLSFFVNSTIFRTQFILLILFGACSKRPHYRGYGSQLHHCSAQYHTLSSRNRILSPPTKRIKLQIAVSFTIAVKLFARLKLPRCQIAFAAALHRYCNFRQDFYFKIVAMRKLLAQRSTLFSSLVRSQVLHIRKSNSARPTRKSTHFKRSERGNYFRRHLLRLSHSLHEGA
jgi:hypothetical protein